MSGYIGSQPADSFLSISSQQITGNGSATYTLNSNVTNPEDVAVFVNNVRQNPNTYSVSNNQITLGGTIASSDSCYVVFLGKTLATVNPPSGSVGNAQVSASLINSQTAESSANDSDEILIYDNSATALKKQTRANFLTGVGGANTPTFLVTKTSNQSISNTTNTVITWQQEVNDSDNAFASNKFTVPSGKGGLYFLNTQIRFNNMGDGDEIQLAFKKNGGYEFYDGNANNYIVHNMRLGGATNIYFQNTAMVNLSASDYIEVAGWHNNGGSRELNYTYCRFSGFKIIT